MSATTAPDLESGFMVLGHDNPNRFQTGIECVLARRREGAGEQRAYLAHECRAESLQPRDIFADNGLYEYAGVHAWNGNFLLRGGAFNYGFNPLANLRRRWPQTVHEPVGWGIVPTCADRPVRVVGFDEALSSLQAGRATGRNRLYMRLSFARAGFAYTLYTACKYTNFTHPELGRERYVQPISGYVLFEEADQFHIAYVVAHLRDGVTTTAEMLVRDVTSFVSVKDPASRLFPIFRLLDRLFLRAFLVTDEFIRIERLPEAHCDLFAYE